jgi:hypothetical protein
MTIIFQNNGFFLKKIRVNSEKKNHRIFLPFWKKIIICNNNNFNTYLFFLGFICSNRTENHKNWNENYSAASKKNIVALQESPEKVLFVELSCFLKVDYEKHLRKTRLKSVLDGLQSSIVQGSIIPTEIARTGLTSRKNGSDEPVVLSHKARCLCFFY